MADGEVRAQDLTAETTSTLSGNEQFVMFDSTEGKRADIDDVATYIAGDKTQLQTDNKTSPVAAINENHQAIGDLKEDLTTESKIGIIEKGKFVHFGDFATLVKGILNSSNLPDLVHKYRVISEREFWVSSDTHIYVNGAFKFSIAFNNNGTRTTSGWIYSDYVIPAGSLFRIQIAGNPESTSTEADITTFNNAVLVQDTFSEVTSSYMKNYHRLITKGNNRFDSYGFFVRGILTNTGTINSSYRYRACSYDILYFDTELNCTIADGYRASFYYFVNGTYSSNSGWVTGNYKIPAGSYVRIQISKLGESSSDVCDVDLFLNQVIYSLPYTEIVKSKVDDELKGIAEDLDTFDSSDFTNGDIDIDGSVITTRKYRVVSPAFFKFPYDVIITSKIGFRFAAYYYTNDVYQNNSGWVWPHYNGNGLLIHSGQQFRVVISRTSDDISEVANVSDFVSKANIYIKQGNGSVPYCGKRVSLESDFESKYCCNVTDWIDFKQTDYPDLANYNLYANQSIAIFGNYVFLFLNEGGAVVVDYTTKAIIASVASPTPVGNHANGVQFLDIYYDVNDEFPLILVSGLYTQVNGAGFVYRITRQGNTFTFSLVNQIIFNHTNYGINWAPDNGNKLLYAVIMLNGDYHVQVDNPIYIAGFKMPSSTDILSGQTITLNDDEALFLKPLEYHVFQDSKAYNGLLYIGLGSGTNYRAGFWIVNPFKGEILSRVTMPDIEEGEGIEIYNGKVYFTQRDGADTSSINPLKISEITF